MDDKKSIDTEVLLTAIESSADYDEFLSENEEHLGVDQFKIALRKFLNESGLTPLEVIEAAHIDRAYGYQLFNGTRKPSRDKVIQLAIAMHVSIAACNNLLKCAQKQPLYAKAQRDSIILYAIAHNLTVDELNELLIKNEQQTL